MADQLTLFMRQVIRSPANVGAVVPSGKFLARRMADGLGPHTGRVVELGPGTGGITKEILRAGVVEENLTLLDVNPAFCDALRQEYPKAQVLHRPAQDLSTIGLNNVGAIVSGLPLLNMTRTEQRAIVTSVFATLRCDGYFVQFTYGTRPPLHRDILREFDIAWTERGKVWANLPPAQVYEFRQVPIMVGE